MAIKLIKTNWSNKTGKRESMDLQRQFEDLGEVEEEGEVQISGGGR